MTISPLRAHIEALRAAIENIVILPEDHPARIAARKVRRNFLLGALHEDSVQEEDKTLVPYFTH